MCEKNKEKISEYIIIKDMVAGSEFKELRCIEKKINSYLEKGYSLYGDLHFREDYICQAMVKYEE